MSADHYRVALGFDYGTKRIGIAVGQELTQTATPLITLTNINQQPDWTSITQLVEEWQPDTFIVGLPINADSTEQAMQRAVKRFGNQLQARYNKPTQWVDERLTSVEAERLIAGTPHQKKRQSAKRTAKKNTNNKLEVDKMAAKLIVESWFEQQTKR